ncbi:hypothetical protein [Nocardioides sp.]|uniref:hypothetical protein n=1 Tax=Nocardioides sp. TaxID=35761 RepID=UPI0039E7092E
MVPSDLLVGRAADIRSCLELLCHYLPAEQRHGVVKAATFAIFLLTILAALTSCDSQSAPPRDDKTVGVPAPDSNDPAAEPIETNRSLDVGQAQAVTQARPVGAGLREVARLGLVRSANTTQGIRAIHEQSVVVGIQSTQEFTGEAPPTRLELRPIGALGHSGEPVQRLPSKKSRQVSAVDMSERWVVWMETPSTVLGLQPWTLVAYDRTDKSVRKLARSPRMDDGGPAISVPGWTGPVIFGTKVYWAQAAGTLQAGRVDVWGCVIEACNPAMVAKAAAMPASDGEYLYLISSANYAGAPSANEQTVDRVDPNTGARSTVARIAVADQEGVSGLAAGPGMLAWTVGRSGADEAVVLNLVDGSVATFADTQQGVFGYPVVTRSAVIWAESGGVGPEVGGYLLDRRDGTLSTIGNKLGLYGEGGDGAYVYWQESRTPQARPEDIDYVVGRLR